MKSPWKNRVSHEDNVVEATKTDNCLTIDETSQLIESNKTKNKKRSRTNVKTTTRNILDRVSSIFSTEKTTKHDSLLTSLVHNPDIKRFVERGSENLGFNCESESFKSNVSINADLEEEKLPEKKAKSEADEKESATFRRRFKSSISDVDACYPRRKRPVFPRVEIAISDVIDKHGNPIERHFEIADSVFFQSPLISADGNSCKCEDSIHNKFTETQWNAKVYWCGHDKEFSPIGVSKQDSKTPVGYVYNGIELDYTMLFARLEMPRDAYNKLITLSALKYLIRPTNEDSKCDSFPAEAFSGNRLLLPSISDAVQFCMYGRAFEELGQCLWYWGSCSVENAIEMLQDKKVGSFIVRNSRKASCPITMTIRTEKGINSVRIDFNAVNSSHFSFDPCCLHHEAEESKPYSLVRTALGYSDILGIPEILNLRGQNLAMTVDDPSGCSYFKINSPISYPIKIYHRATVQHLSRLALNQLHETWKNPKKVFELSIDPAQMDYLLKYPYPV